MNAVETPGIRRVGLDDGAELLVRPVRAEDKELIADGFERLSPESRYRRFFAPLQRLTESDLRYLTEVDHRDHEALAAIDPESGRLVGVARYVRGVEGQVAEVSVVVGDDWQRRGVATAILELLVERAHEEGITHFTALVLTENRDAIELFDRLDAGNGERRRSASGHLELRIELPEPGAMPGSRLARVLRTVARGAVPMSPYRVLRDRIRRVAPR